MSSILARIALVFPLASLLPAQPLPNALFDGLRWRLVGPFRGGRAVAASGVPGDSNTFYFGSVGGGVWKTVNAGVTWSPIFDDQHVASIGALEVAPSDPNVIYVGTGEADIRSDLASGDGVYKSTDAGRTWRNIGLRDSFQIGRILIDPKNADIVYVAALGHAYGPNAERGVYKSTDGGANWRKVLDRGPDAGAVDLAFEPENPRAIYATIWHTRRPPWSVYGPLEGPGSGLFKSTDGGETWMQISGHGLPAEEWGRSGVVVARGVGGQRVYALVETPNNAKNGGLFRSDDSGETWTHITADPRVGNRAWYFSAISIDPGNPDIVYIPNISIYQSLDGGKTFSVLKGAPGGDDYHSLWIDPTQPARMIQASDQGVSISVDRGLTWSTWYNQPTAQFYHVVTDNAFPYHVYGSQQDSGTAGIASRTDHGGIDPRDWFSVGGAESGYIAPDPRDPNIFYVSNMYGSLTRFDRRTSEGQNISPWPSRAFGAQIAARKYRFPWTAPLVFSATEPGALYFGSQFVLKSTDGGLHWREISPDLTGDERKAGKAADSGPVSIENAKARGYGVIYSIGPSPLDARQIWAGSDTGLIHLTHDGGKTWLNVTPKGLGDWSKVTHIEASHFNAGEAYAAVDRHRVDDYRPYLYRTRDYGKNWEMVAGGIAERAFLNAVREDPARRGLLYAATEFGVYVSFDDADHWQPLQLNLPAVSVRDLVVHGDDLAIATHGRAFWILDDIAPLRQIDAKTAASDVLLYKPATAIRLNPDGFQGTPLPPEIPTAANPPDGAILDYYLASAPSGELTLDILDASNQVVRRYSTSDGVPEPRREKLVVSDIWAPRPARLASRAGMNRFVWDLRYAPSSAPEEEGEEMGPPLRGPRVLPGTYEVRLTVAGRSYTQPLKVMMDPRSKATPADLAKQHALAMRVVAEMRRAAEVKGAKAVLSELSAVLGVVDSSDRTPPQQAYDLFEEARRKLAALAAK